MVAATLIATPAAAQSGVSALGRQAFVAVAGDGDPARRAALLRASIDDLGGRCERAARFQVFRRTPTVATLKIECVGRPIYLLSVDAEGGMLLDGGDGVVMGFDPADGEVVVAPAESVAAAIIAAVTPTVGAGAPPRWLLAPLALAGVAAAAYALYRRAARRAALPARRHDSAAKDRMIAEARQLATNLWRHPSGLWIARGKRGKRRLFRNRPFAEAYRRWGFKFGQVR